MSSVLDNKINFWTKNLSIILDVSQFDAIKFGKWLKEKREAIRPKLSITALAEKADVSKQYISLLEKADKHFLTNKHVQPALDKVERLAIALEVDLNEAREMAGYEELVLVPFDAHRVSDGVTITFNRKLNISPDQKKRILEAVRLITVGIKTELGDFEPVEKDPAVEDVWYDKEGFMITTIEGIKNLKKLSGEADSK